MRWISGIVVVLIVAAWFIIHLDDSQPLADSQIVHSLWRHTTGGWEKLSALSATAAQSLHPEVVSQTWRSNPHPIIIALLVALLSLMALIAFSPDKRAVAKVSPYQKVIPSTGELHLRSRAWLDAANSKNSNETPAPPNITP